MSTSLVYISRSKIAGSKGMCALKATVKLPCKEIATIVHTSGIVSKSLNFAILQIKNDILVFFG